MAERRLSSRLLLGSAAVLLGAAEALALTQTLERHARRWEPARYEARESVARARSALQAAARSRGPAGACAVAVRQGLGAEAEAFTPRGRRTAAFPASVSVSHWPTEEQRRRLATEPLVFGPTGTSAPRILVYLGLGEGAEAFVLRVARPARSELSALPEAHRAELLAHAGVLVLALGALVLLAAPVPLLAVEGSGPLRAYEQAIDQLRSRGEALSREHDEERRRMEGELKELEALARAGELTAGVVHEVRNGLGTVMGYARLLERDPRSAAANEAGIRIREECETLEQVVRRFVDYVRRERLELGPIAVQRVLGRVVAREGRAHDGLGARVEIAEDIVLVGDEGLLERAFENVVRNAFQASPADGAIRVAARIQGDEVVVVIEDEGPGLALSAREALRPFRSARQGGLGLGLAIASKLIRLHGGRIALEQAQPRGLRVSVHLPRSGPTVLGAPVTDRNIDGDPGLGGADSHGGSSA